MVDGFTLKPSQRCGNHYYLSQSDILKNLLLIPHVAFAPGAIVKRPPSENKAQRDTFGIDATAFRVDRFSDLLPGVGSARAGLANLANPGLNDETSFGVFHESKRDSVRRAHQHRRRNANRS